MASPVLVAVGGLATVEHLRFAASMAIEATTRPFTRSFWCDIAAVAGVDPVDLVAKAIATGAFVWGGAGDFIVLLRDGKAVAACAAYGTPDLPSEAPLRRDRLPGLFRDLGVPVERLAPTIDAYDAIWSGAKALPFALAPAGWIIENVAVARHVRGQGLLAPLIGAALARGVDRGHTAARLTLIVGNDRAETAYRRLGFEVSGIDGPEWFDAGSFPGLVKMRRCLRPPAQGDASRPRVGVVA